MATSQTHMLKPAPLGWLREQSSAIALSLTALAGALRLYQVNANGFSLDEIASVWRAGQDPASLAWTILLDHGDNTPPTYYLLLHAFLQFGQEPLLVRGLSVLAGAGAVWLVYQLGAHLFDARVATLGAFLLAVSPLHIQYSQLARAYALADLWALLSLCLFARIVFGPSSRRHWIGLVAASAAAFCTFYLTVLVILFENFVVLVLWLRRGLADGFLRRWVISQAVIATCLPITLLSVLSVVTVAEQGRGLTWLPRPGIEAVIKSAILFTTGDPSYGPTGVTWARAVSLAVIVGLGLLLLWVYFRRQGDWQADREGQRVLYLAGAVALPWVVDFAVSQLKPVYHEKYLLYILPPLLILIAWAIVRCGRRNLRLAALVALILVTGRALFVFYTAPVGEQWREAVAYVRPRYQAGDLVIFSPGYYMRPFTYYFYGAFPSDTREVAHAEVVVLSDGEFRPLPVAGDGVPQLGGVSSPASRIWFLSGYSPPDENLRTWLERSMESREEADYLGARVQLLVATGSNTKTADGR